MSLTLNDLGTITGIVLGGAGLLVSIFVAHAEYKQRYVPKLRVSAGAGRVAPGIDLKDPSLYIVAANPRAAPVVIAAFELTVAGSKDRTFLRPSSGRSRPLPHKVNQGEVVQWAVPLASIYDAIGEHQKPADTRFRIHASSQLGNEFRSSWVTLHPSMIEAIQRASKER